MFERLRQLIRRAAGKDRQKNREVRNFFRTAAAGINNGVITVSWRALSTYRNWDSFRFRFNGRLVECTIEDSWESLEVSLQMLATGGRTTSVRPGPDGYELARALQRVARRRRTTVRRLRDEELRGRWDEFTKAVSETLKHE